MNLDLRALLPENDKKTMENYINMHANRNTTCKNIDDEIYKLFKGVIYTVWNEADIMELTYKYPENQTSIMNLAKIKNCLPCPSGVHLKM